MNLSANTLRDKRHIFEYKRPTKNSSQSPKSIFFVKIPKVTREDLLLPEASTIKDCISNKKATSEIRIRTRILVKAQDSCKIKCIDPVKQFKIPDVDSAQSLLRPRNSFFRGINLHEIEKARRRCLSNSNKRFQSVNRELVPGKYKKIVVTLNNLLS